MPKPQLTTETLRSHRDTERLALDMSSAERDIDSLPMPQKPFKAIGFAVLIWIVGFVWGSIVFMTPALKATAPIPYISRQSGD